jgi:hypothetical protein
MTLLVQGNLLGPRLNLGGQLSTPAGRTIEGPVISSAQVHRPVLSSAQAVRRSCHALQLASYAACMPVFGQYFCSMQL